MDRSKLVWEHIAKTDLQPFQNRLQPPQGNVMLPMLKPVQRHAWKAGLFAELLV
jgi:hypothetical protein